MQSLQSYSPQASPEILTKTAEAWPRLTEQERNELATSLQCSTNLIASLVASSLGDLKASVQLSRYSAELSVSQALNAPGCQLSVLRRYDENTYYKTIILLLTRAKELLNATNTLSNSQMADLAVRISKEFYFYKLEELLLIIQKATDGRYGRDFNRLDASVVMDWIRRYDIEERTPLVTNKATEKPSDLPDKPTKLNDEQLQAFHDRVAAGEKTVVNPEPKRVADLDREAQKAARMRYVEEKKTGIVADYSSIEPTNYQPVNDSQ